MSIYWFDLVAGVLLLVFAGFGWVRGLVKEFFFTAAWVGAYLAALFFYQQAAHPLKSFVTFAPLADLLGFLILFAGVYLLIRLVEYLIQEKLGLKMPRMVDAPGGALLGSVKGFVVLALLLVALGYWPSAYQSLLANSYLLRLTRYLAHPSGPFRGAWPSSELKNDFDELKGKIPDMKELKESLPAVPPIPTIPAETAPSTPSLAVPQKIPALQPQPLSPKAAASQPVVSPPQPVSPKKGSVTPITATATSAPPAAVPAPRIKQVEPVKKNRPDPVSMPPEDENQRMDKFIKSLD